jgi:apolipoprotein N-acyltransferase
VYVPDAELGEISPVGNYAILFRWKDGHESCEFPPVSPLICYEDIMPEFARAAVADKNANLLVNMTNDAWFGRTIAPYQHARLSQLRAIETRRTLVRVTNTGLTTIIDARGETVQDMPIYTPAVLTAKVELMEGKTPYVKFGDWFGWVVTVIALGVIAWSWKKR